MIEQFVDRPGSQGDPAAIRRGVGSTEAVKRDPRNCVIDANVDGMLIVDRDGVVRFHNPAAESDFGIRSGELLRRVGDVGRLSEGGDEIEMVFGAGGRRVAALKGSSILWEGEQCRFFSVRDVTTHKETEAALRQANQRLQEVVEQQSLELKRAVGEMRRQIGHRHQTERELIDSEERFRLAFEHGIVGKAIVDVEDRIVQANLALANMLGTTQQELFGVTLQQRKYGNGTEPELTFARRLLDGDIPQYTVETELVKEDGTAIVARITSNVISRCEGRPIYVLNLIENVTEQRRHQEAARRQERLAAIGTLAAGIAHEINNPVGAALLSAETGLSLFGKLDRPESLESLRECLETIVVSSERCGQIIRDTLRFSQENECEKRPSNINAIASKSKDLVQMAIKRSGADVTLQLDESLPQIRVNELEIELVFVNLIKNAMQAGGPTRIVVETRLGEGCVEAAVSDDGPGMSAYQKSRAFDPFYTTRQSTGGTGLGLSIVHGIVQDHHGTIEIDSEIGEGTTVRICLPLGTEVFKAEV